MLSVITKLVCVTEVVPMAGTDNIVTRRVLDTVSTTPHVTRRLVCVTEAVMLDGKGINVMKVRYTRAFKL